VAKASYTRQKRNQGLTEYVVIPGRGHSITIDHGWREVADMALAFVRRVGGAAHACPVSFGARGTRCNPLMP
jgi:hypothetical protein